MAVNTIKCDGQGLIAVSEIMTAVNNNTDNIEALHTGSANFGGDVTKLTQQVIGNTSRIKAIETGPRPPSHSDMSRLEGHISTNTTDIAALKSSGSSGGSGIAKNAADIVKINSHLVTTDAAVAKNKADIATTNVGLASVNAEVYKLSGGHAGHGQDLTKVKADVVKLQAETKVLDTTTKALRTDITKNKDDITKLGEELELSRFLSSDEKSSGGGGTASANIWAKRPIGHTLLNSMGVSAGTDSVTLSSGEYIIKASAAGSGDTQSRLKIGSVYTYGTFCEGGGMSEMIAYLNTGSNTKVEIETIVSAANGNDTLGKASPFHHGRMFLKLDIRKVK